LADGLKVDSCRDLTRPAAKGLTQRGDGRGAAMDDEPLARFSFETRVIYWRGPSPFFYAPIPEPHVKELRQLAKIVTYGWGMVPVDVQIGDVGFNTSLFPKDGGYLLPLKAEVRRRTNVTADDVIAVELTIQPPATY
jgi:hypothetical protein